MIIVISISRDSVNPAKLWQSMSQLVGRQNNNALLQATPHTADTFLMFFGDIVQAPARDMHQHLSSGK